MVSVPSDGWRVSRGPPSIAFEADDRVVVPERRLGLVDAAAALEQATEVPANGRGADPQECSGLLA